MRAYVAILIDSFWEAVGNKVLWALLIGWSLVLLALLPFGYITESSFKLSSFDIDKQERIIEKLARGLEGGGSPAVRAVASQLDEDFAKRVKLAARSDGESGREIRSSQVAEALSRVLAVRDLYSKQAFPTADRRKRLQPLIEMPAEERSEADVEELNRELLQLAFPLELRTPRGQQLWIGYAGFKLGDALPISRRQIQTFIEPLIFGLIISFGLGFIAVFISIIVTSPMIPDTFKSGSLHLLLSKPISRIWLYLSKFFGGCIFVLFNITFVLIGLYLIAGIRFDIWNNGLLACIPLLLFIFIIFYSVSALVGLIWGNAIVSVVACILFWLFCFAIGAMHGVLMPRVEIARQINRIHPIEDNVFAINQEGELNVWNAEFAVWQPAYDAETRGRSKTVGPIYTPQRRQIIAKTFVRGPFGDLNSRGRQLAIIRLGDSTQSQDSEAEQLRSNEAADGGAEESDAQAAEPTGTERDRPDKNDSNGQEDLSSQPESVEEAREMARWMTDVGPDLPAELFEVIEVGEEIIAVCRGGLYRLDLERMEMMKAGQQALFGIKLPFASTTAFENIAPDAYYLSENAYGAATAEGDGMIVYNSGSVDRLQLESGKFKLAAQTELEGEGTEAAIVQANRSYSVVARDGLPVLVLDPQLEQTLHEVSLPSGSNVRHMAWIPDSNRIAIITHQGSFLELDCATAEVTPIDNPFQGECTAMKWISPTTVWLGVKPDDAYLLNIESNQIERRLESQPTTLETVFSWVIKPIYVVNPKPSAMNDAIGYVLSGRETQSLGIVPGSLERAQLEIDVWSPIISNTIFVAILLAIGCVYVARKEF